MQSTGPLRSLLSWDVEPDGSQLEPTICTSIRNGSKLYMVTTAGITVDANGRLTIDKEYRGVRLFRRLGRVSQEIAQLMLRNGVARVQDDLDRRTHARPLRSATARHATWENRGTSDLRTSFSGMSDSCSHPSRISNPSAFMMPRCARSAIRDFAMGQARARSTAASKSYARFSIVRHEPTAMTTVRHGYATFPR